YGATDAVCHVVDAALAPIVLGQDPTQIESLVDRMHRALMIWGRRGLAMMAVSGVELALWDLVGKARNAPVYELLGGLCQSRLRVYASLLRYDTPSQVGQAVAATVALGHGAVKLHQVDVESVAVAREVAGAGAADIVQPSVTKVGGLLEMKKIAVLAAAANVTLVPHSFYYGPGLAASLHLAAATPGVPYVEFPGTPLVASLTAEPIRFAGGA